MHRNKKIAITGASGFIGRQLVQYLSASGFEILVIGRDTSKLDLLFPNIDNCTYADIPSMCKGFDILIHLAVLNNIISNESSSFEQVNVDLFSDVIESAKAAGIGLLLNITTFQAVDGNNSPYARSKQKALAVARNSKGITIKNVFLPAVYGDEFSGRLSIIKFFPNISRKYILSFLSSLYPTLNINIFFDFIINYENEKFRDPDIYLANPMNKNVYYKFFKNSIDISFSLIVILFFWWTLFIIWCAVLCTSGRPGIFAQERVGQNGKAFVCYKFRTMKQNTQQAGTHELPAASVTNFGKILRKTKIDELPQVWNILRGELSLVGPRPCLQVQETLILRRKEYDVFSVRPGITGLAQINGIDMSDPDTLALWDARYIAQQCIITDLKIIFATLGGRGQGDRIKG